MNIITKFINKKPSKVTAKFLIKFGGYFDGELYRFTESENGLILTKSNDNFRPKFLVVSANQYQEINHQYPIENIKELNKLLKLEFSDNQKVLIQSQLDTHSKVNSWKFSVKVPKAWVTVPESLLLTKHCYNGDVLKVYSRSNEITYMTSFNKVIQSASNKGIIDSTQKFAMSAGAQLAKDYDIEYKNKAVIFANTLTLLTIKEINVFLTKPSTNKLKVLGAQFVIPTMASVFIYLLLSSSYLLLKTSLLEDNLVQQSDEVTTLLTLQEQIDNGQLMSQQLSNFWKNKNGISGLWLALDPIFELSSIRTVTLQNDKFLIRGRTPDASKLLDIVANNPNVSVARFEAPVRKERNQDSFQIGLELNSGQVKFQRSDLESDQEESHNE